MHKKFTLNVRAVSRVIVFILLAAGNTFAQDLAQWTNGKYGNEWIDYSKKYVRIAVPSNGVYRLPASLLPSDFPKDDPSRFQLWHRGIEVAIISASSTEIVFYAEKNDGASDGLLYRPGPEARTNIYSSLFSDNGSYILTYNAKGKRVQTVNGTSYSGDPEAYHFQKVVKTYNNQYSFGTLTTEPTPLNNSFYEIQNSWVSPTLKGSGSSDESSKLDDSFQLTNWASDAVDKPVIQALVIGMHYGIHKLNFSVGKSNANTDHTNILASLTFSGIDAKSVVTTSIPNTSLNSTGGVFRVRSTTTAGELNDWTSLANYVLTYPQLTNMSGIASAYYNFKASAQPVHIGITNAESDVVLYNISNIDNPNIVTGTNVGGTYHASVTRSASEELHLLAIRPSDIKTVDVSNVAPITLQPYITYPAITDASSSINAGSYDYLIITATPFLEEAKNYAIYRNSSSGGSYRVAVFEIKSLYAQFNYGEPSPIAIKRFTEYMLKDGIRPQHNVLLIGNSVTTPDGTVVRLRKEMPDEIPTIGDPGSDNLLVSGVHGLNEDIPAIPIGRIPALSAPGSGSPDPSRVANYLSKVQTYEHQTGDKSWRRNMLHLVGAKTGELAEFSSYLNVLLPIARTLDSNKPIETLTTSGTSSNDQPANITTQINNGVGMIAYYGHGSWNQTQLNIGNITKANNTLSSSDLDFNFFSDQGGSYNANNEKYPFMYFNGCGVGNAFSGRNSTYIALASDWLLAPKRGAIAIIASSFNSYATPTKDYLIDLYTEIFTRTDAQRNSIGIIRDNIAKKIVSGNSGTRVTAIDPYYIANIHQANLFGDPVLRVLITSDVPALPVEFAEVKATLNLNKSVQVQWKTAWEKSNSYFVIERSSDARSFTALGSMEGKGTISTLSSYQYTDNNPNSGANYYRIKQVDKGGELVGFSYSRVVFVNNPSDTNEEIRVYPNPSASLISIEVMTSSNIKSWSFVNLKGAILKIGSESSFSVDGFPNGEYILNVQTNDGKVYQKKVMKK